MHGIAGVVHAGRDSLGLTDLMYPCQNHSAAYVMMILFPVQQRSTCWLSADWKLNVISGL